MGQRVGADCGESMRRDGAPVGLLLKNVLTPGTVAAVGLSLVAGAANAGMIAVVGRFGVRIGILPALAFTSTIGAVAAIAALPLIHRGFHQLLAGFRAPAWMWFAGLLGTLFGFSIIFAGPRIGTTPTIALAIAGQVAVGATIDRFGIFGLARIGLTPPRILAILLLIGGSVLTLHR